MTIATLLARANGRRRIRILSDGDVERILDKVRAGSVYASTHGGSVPNSYKYKASTTVALAARVDGRVYVGVREGPAHAASPGRTWKCLQPWEKGDMNTKLRAWVQEPDVTLVEGGA